VASADGKEGSWCFEWYFFAIFTHLRPLFKNQCKYAIIWWKLYMIDIPTPNYWKIKVNMTSYKA